MRANGFWSKLFLTFALGAGGGCVTTPLIAATPVEVPPPQPDPHYTQVGFFDVRLCHWPDRPKFLQLLFSTTKYDLVRKVEAFDPDGRLVGELNLDKFRLLKQKDGSVKRVFITPLPLPADARGGWYTGRITTVDGTVYLARDLVRIRTLPMAANPRPAAGAENIAAPVELSWDPVPGARMYQVFVHDIWEDEALIFRSPHLTENRVKLPKGLLKPGGYYMWRVHARDVDEDIELGDFNDGSLTPYFKFSVR
jgi:hypothetical protein